VIAVLEGTQPIDPTGTLYFCDAGGCGNAATTWVDLRIEPPGLSYLLGLCDEDADELRKAANA